MLRPSIRVAPSGCAISRTCSTIPIQQCPPQFGMGYLPAAKRNRELNTLAVSYKASDVLYFEIDVMLARQRAHLDFFDRAGRALNASNRGSFFFCAYRYLSKSVIRQTGGCAVGATSTRSSPRLSATRNASANAQDADLAAIGINHADFGRANQPVDTNRRLPRRWGTKVPTDKPPPSALRPSL